MTSTTPMLSSIAPGTSAFIPLCAPEIAGNEWAYVRECLDSGWVSSAGEYVDRFERALAEATGTRSAVATVNGTAALHLACLIVGIRPGDEVLVSALTFIAPANAIRYAGAWPVFVDAEPDYWQMDVAKARQFLEVKCSREGTVVRNRTTGRPVRAILPVHVLGHPVDMAPLLSLAREFGLVVIEDATESLGATYRDRPVGQLGDVACFSFNGNKLITTGGGGMLVTNNEALGQRARYLSTQAKDDALEYVHGAVGYNYRLTNIQAAMGVAQMEQLGKHLAAKRRIAERYGEACRKIPGLTPMREALWARSAHWMFTVLVDEGAFGMDSRELLRHLAASGIQARPLWEPLHRSPAHPGAPCTDCSVAEHLNRVALSLPCSVGLSDADQDTVIAALRSAHASSIAQ
jgi:perosamine synthetase